MMDETLFKYPLEQLWISYNFADLLEPGETIQSAEWIMAPMSGTDTEAQSMIDGDPDLSMTPIMRQRVIGGVEGMTYVLICRIVTNSRTLEHRERFEIRSKV